MISTKTGLIAAFLVLSAAVGFGSVMFVFGGNSGTKAPGPTPEVRGPTATIEPSTPTASSPAQVTKLPTKTPTSTTGQEELTAIPAEPTKETTKMPTPEPTIETKTPTREPTKEATEPPIDLSDPASIIGAAQDFLDKRGATTLLTDQTYQLARFDGPAQRWVVFTTAVSDKSWLEGIGSGGFITIAHLENGQLVFRLPSDEGFIEWLRQLPEGLLPESLQEWYDPTAESSLSESLLSALGSTQPTLPYLPFPAEAKYQITALPGSEQHTGDHKYAIDLGLPEGAPIAASIGGKVLSFKDDSNSGGCSTTYDKDANYILIEVTPGDAILYLHLQVGSVTANKIQVGQTIEAEQIIAASGSTGFTCGNGSNGRGAHLHIERGAPYNNLKRIRTSTPLSFVEFGPTDPQARVDYVSKNLSPEKRKALEEEEKQARDQQEIAAIKGVIDRFHIVYQCSTVKTCDESNVIAGWVTGAMFEELFHSFCFFCPEKWDENNLVFEEYLPFPLPEGDRVEVVEKEKWNSRMGEEKFRSYAVVNHFLLMEGGVWKVDGYKITCWYRVKLLENGDEGEIVDEENLTGCPWQPPSGGS